MTEQELHDLRTIVRLQRERTRSIALARRSCYDSCVALGEQYDREHRLQHELELRLARAEGRYICVADSQQQQQHQTVKLRAKRVEELVKGLSEGELLALIGQLSKLVEDGNMDEEK